MRKKPKMGKGKKKDVLLFERLKSGVHTLSVKILGNHHKH